MQQDLQDTLNALDELLTAPPASRRKRRAKRASGVPVTCAGVKAETDKIKALLDENKDNYIYPVSLRVDCSSIQDSLTKHISRSPPSVATAVT